MGQIVVNVGSFDLTSHNGNTAYSSQRYFTIPANAGITKCVATFATHVNTGNFQGKSFALNSVQAHPNTPWPTSGIELNPSLLSAGQNAFRAAVKSQAGLSARWSIGDIYLTIDFNDIGGGGTPPPNIGAVTINKTSLVAGDTITVSASACDAVYSRSVYLMLADNTVISSFGFNFGTGAASWTVTVPESLCAAYAADSENLILKAYMEVYQTGTYVGSDAKNFTMQVPSSAVPTIGAFTAALNANGVDAAITGYVQGYSKCNLAMGSVAGALGSSIAAYEIYGGGWYLASSSASYGPFAQTGNITFTARVTDSRGRTATRTVSINVLAYAPPSFSNPEAWRSSDTGAKNQKGTYARLKSGVSYSSLDSQNSVTLKGRVYPKGGTVPAYTSMTPDTEWITGGGTLLVTKTYIAQMEVADLIGSRVIEFTIPTKKTGISIMARMLGAAIGKAAETPGILDVLWPIYSEDHKVLTEADCPYAVGDILQTLNTAAPADRWPGTTWDDIAGRVLVGLDSAQAEFDTAGEEGGSKTVQLGLDSGYAKFTHDSAGVQYMKRKSASWTSEYGVSNLPAGNNYAGAMTQGLELGGTTDSGSNLQPYKVVYIWLRTA